MKHFSPDMQRARWEARILGNALLKKGIKLTSVAVLDVVALMHGWESWKAWSQEQDWVRPPDPGRRENKNRGARPPYNDKIRKAPGSKDGMTFEVVD